MMVSYHSLKRSLVRVASGVNIVDGARTANAQGVKYLPVLAAALCVCGWLSASASAQLRSGRTTRSLYADEAPARPAAGRPAAARNSARDARQNSARDSAAANSGQRRPAPVVSASHTQPLSVTEDSSYDDYGDSQFAPMDEGMTYFDSGSHSNFDSGSFGAQRFGAGSCGEPGCDSCGSYSAVAPTCTSMACSPGTGPLMALWCRTSVRAEVPLYWRRAMEPPPLVTTSPTGTDPDLAGQLGQSTTQLLLGGNGDKLDERLNAGVRLTFSTWLGSEKKYALMFRYWNAGDQDNTFNFSSNQFPILARPFLDTSAAIAAQNTQLVAFPGDTIGNISVATESEVDGLELTLKRLIYQDRFTQVHGLYGYQHVSIDESLSVFSNTTVTGVPGLQGNTIAVRDTFRTENDFNGVAYGLMGSRQIACWKMETLFRLGMGNLRRKVNINGSTTTTANGAVMTSSQGLLARNTNDRSLVDDTFVVVPEVGVNFATQIRPGLDFNVGYNYLMVPKVAQASQQINDNLAVNLSDPLVGALDPSLNLDERKFWLHSLGLGLQLRY